MARQTIAEQLDRARVVLDAIRTNADLKTRLAQLGYDEAALAQGQALYDAAVAVRGDTHSAHGRQLGATREVQALRERVEEQVSALSQMARTIFADNPAALETLGLRMGERATPEAAPATEPEPGAAPDTPRRRRPSDSQAALLDRARTLYDGALNDPMLLSSLALVGYDRPRLEAERSQVAALEAADTTQEGRKVSAKARTAEQEAALDALNEWVARLRGVARAGLRDAPELQDLLGL